jgi:hypothetical protein
LPRPLTIPDLLTLETLADVRALVEKHLPAEYRAEFTWHHLASLAQARGGWRARRCRSLNRAADHAQRAASPARRLNVADSGA